MDDRELTNSLLRWLEILNKGYVKPDVNASKSNVTGNTTGIVSDTKDFMPYIDKINEKLAYVLSVDNVDLSSVVARRNKNY